MVASPPHVLYISALVGGCGARTPLRSPLLKFNCTEVVMKKLVASTHLRVHTFVYLPVLVQPTDTWPT